MKKILIIVIVQLTALIAVSQYSISNTKWMVHTEIPRSRDMTYEFKKDTLTTTNERGMENNSFFSQHGDSLFFRKISGNSPCPDGSQGWYRIEWLENGEKFLLHRINDSCAARIYDRLTVIKKIKEAN